MGFANRFKIRINEFLKSLKIEKAIQSFDWIAFVLLLTPITSLETTPIFSWGIALNHHPYLINWSQYDNICFTLVTIRFCSPIGGNGTGSNANVPIFNPL